MKIDIGIHDHVVAAVEKEKSEKSFFDTHNAAIIRLFELADIDGELPKNIDDPMVLHDFALSRWMKGDHWNPDNKWANSIKPEDLPEFYQIVADLGLVGEVRPAKGTVVDEIVIVGSTFSANFRRTALAKELIDAGDIVFANNQHTMSVWAGQRRSMPSEWEDFDGFVGGDVSHVSEVFSDETEMAAFALTTLYGVRNGSSRSLPEPTKLYLPPPAEHSNPDDPNFQEIPPLSSLGIRDYALFEYEVENLRLRLLNARAVERPQGMSRHTTESSAKEWLALSNDLPHGYTILEVNGNPHAYRINKEIQRVLAEAGRPDINVISAAIATRTDAPPSLYLGEIARILYNNY